MMFDIIKRSISSSILLNAQPVHQTESHLLFRETDPDTGNPDITISFNQKEYDCVGLDFSWFNAYDKPVTNIVDCRAEKVNKLSDGLIIGREKGSEKIFAIIIEMKSGTIQHSDVKLQLNGTQALFEYITNLIDLQFEDEEVPDISLYRFCFSLKVYSSKQLKLSRKNLLRAQWNKSSHSYTLSKHKHYNIKHLLEYRLQQE